MTNEYANSIALVDAPGNRSTSSRKPIASWQNFVLAASGPGIGESTSDGNVHLRFDASSDPVSELRSWTNWTADVGWHQSSPELPAAQKAEDEQQPSPLPFSTVTVDRSDAPSAAVEERSAAPVPSHKQANASKHENAPRFADLIAEIAHDIRAPIAVAKQIVSAVTDQARSTGSLSDGEIELLDVATMRLVEANKWAEGILIGRCLEQGTPINIRRRFYPSQWKTSVEALLCSVAARRRVSLNWIGWDRSLPRMYLDENQITRAILNLVTNAVQASPFGGNVSIRVSMENAVTQRLVITIVDRGAGLDAELLEQLNSEEAVLNPETRMIGSGLGLHTAKSLVLATGGAIHGARCPEGGTSIRVSLPTDHPPSLLRSWLVQNLRADSQADSKAELNSPRKEVQLHAIRASGMDMQFCDAQLQQSAMSSDLVYRLGNDRWLWFSLVADAGDSATQPENPTLDAALRRLNGLHDSPQADSGCNSKMVYRIRNVDLHSADRTYIDPGRLSEVAHLLTAQIDRLSGGRVPAVDDISKYASSIVFRSSNGKSHRQIRQDMPHSPFASRDAARQPASTKTNPGPGLMDRPGLFDRVPAMRGTVDPEANRLSAIATTAAAQRQTALSGNQPLRDVVSKPGSTDASVSATQANLTLRAISEVANILRADQSALQTVHGNMAQATLQLSSIPSQPAT